MGLGVAGGGGGGWKKFGRITWFSGRTNDVADP